MKKTVFVLFSVLMFLFVYVPSSFSLGVPTVESLLGQEIAQSIAMDAFMRIKEDMSNAGGLKSYEKALKEYEKKLRKLREKHSKQRRQEERILESLIDDMKSYSRQDAARGEVNRTQEEKQRKLYEHVEEFQNNDRERAREIEQFIEENYPKMESFMKTM